MGRCLGLIGLLSAATALGLGVPGPTCAQIDRPSVAVLNLEPMGGQITSGEAAVLSDRFRYELGETRVFDLMERRRMEDILREHGLSLSGCVDRECAVQYGQILLVERMVAGSIGKIGQTYTVAVRMFDVSTSKIESQATVDCRGCEIDDVLLETLRKLAEQFVAKGEPLLPMAPDEHGELVKTTVGLPERGNALGVVVAVTEDRILLDVGLDQGAETNTVFRVIARQGAAEIGELAVTHPGKAFSYARWIRRPPEGVEPAGAFLRAVGLLWPDQYGEQLLTTQGLPNRGSADGVLVDTLADGHLLIDIGTEESIQQGTVFSVITRDETTEVGEIEVVDPGRKFSYARWIQGPSGTTSLVGSKLKALGRMSPDKYGTLLRAANALPDRGGALGVLAGLKDGKIVIDLGSVEGARGGSRYYAIAPRDTSLVGQVEITDLGSDFSYARWVGETPADAVPVGLWLSASTPKKAAMFSRDLARDLPKQAPDDVLIMPKWSLVRVHYVRTGPKGAGLDSLDESFHFEYRQFATSLLGFQMDYLLLLQSHSDASFSIGPVLRPIRNVVFVGRYVSLTDGFEGGGFEIEGAIANAFGIRAGADILSRRSDKLQEYLVGIILRWSDWLFLELEMDYREPKSGYSTLNKVTDLSVAVESHFWGGIGFGLSAERTFVGDRVLSSSLPGGQAFAAHLVMRY